MADSKSLSRRASGQDEREFRVPDPRFVRVRFLTFERWLAPDPFAILTLTRFLVLPMILGAPLSGCEGGSFFVSLIYTGDILLRVPLRRVKNVTDPLLPALDSRDPNLYIIAGPNGAGKTTFAQQYLPNYAHCENFINADLIAQGVSPFAPEKVAFHAGRLMLEEIQLHAERKESFGFETTLSGRSYLALIRRLKKREYKVHVFFLWIPSVDLALSRVRARVLAGGHNIPEPVVRRRFDRSIRNFMVDYRQLAHSWILFDNSGAMPAALAFATRGKHRIMNSEVYEALVKRYGEA